MNCLWPISCGSRSIAGWRITKMLTTLASQEPTFRLIGSREIWEWGADLTSRLQLFQNEVLTQEENLAGLAALNRDLVARVEDSTSPRRVVLVMDCTEMPVKTCRKTAISRQILVYPCIGDSHQETQRSVGI
jgi:hypothetical protein